MNRLLLLSFILVISAACNFSHEQPNESAKKEIVSDHAYLEEAKAIAKQLIEGSERVEKKELTRAEFEKKSRPLQRQLNLLIMSLDKEELKQLEKYRNELLVQSAQKRNSQSKEF